MNKTSQQFAAHLAKIEFSKESAKTLKEQALVSGTLTNSETEKQHLTVVVQACDLYLGKNKR